MTPRAIVFDMDGLMFDTERLALECWLEAGAAHGYAIDRATLMETVGRDVHDTRRILERDCGTLFPFQRIRAERIRLARARVAASGVPIKDGLLDLLERLRRSALATAVATSTERAVALDLLRQAGVVDLFGAVACGDEVDRGKPEPDIFLLAAERLGVNPAAAIVLEDSETGVTAAVRAGMRAILVPDLRPAPVDPPTRAHAVCRSLVEAGGVIFGWLEGG